MTTIKGTGYYSGQDILPADVERDQQGFGEEVLTHFNGTVNSARIGTTVALDQPLYACISHDIRSADNFPYSDYSGAQNYDFHITVNSTNTSLFDVGKLGTAGVAPTGLGYDTVGEKITIIKDEAWNYLAPSLTPAASTGNIGIDLLAAGGAVTLNAWNYIYIKWLEIRTPSIVSLDPIDGSTQYIGRDDGYIILAASGAGSDPDTYLLTHQDYIYIGKIQANGPGGSLTGRVYDDVSNRYYMTVDARHIKARTPVSTAQRTATYGINQLVTLEDHIRAIGDETVDQLNPHGSATAHLVKADSADPTPGYLDIKVDNVTLKVSAHVIYTTITGTPDHKVKADSSDPTANYLDVKVDGGTIMLNGSYQVYIPAGGITHTEIGATIINADLAVNDGVGGPIIRKGHLDNTNSSVSISSLVDSTNADSLHTHLHSKSFVDNSSYTFSNYTTPVGGAEHLAYSVTVPVASGQQVTVIWDCFNGSDNSVPSARESTVRLSIIEGSTTETHTVTVSAAGAFSAPLPIFLMETIRATTNGGVLIQCYTQYTGGSTATGRSTVTGNRLSLMAGLDV